MDSSKKMPMEGVGVKNCKNLPTSSMDGPLQVSSLSDLFFVSKRTLQYIQDNILKRSPPGLVF